MTFLLQHLKRKEKKNKKQKTSSHVPRIDQEPYSVAVAEDNFKLLIPLPPPLRCWPYRYIPPCPVYLMQGRGLEFKASCMLHKCSTNWAHPQSPTHTFKQSLKMYFCLVVLGIRILVIHLVEIWWALTWDCSPVLTEGLMKTSHFHTWCVHNFPPLLWATTWQKQ